VDYNPNYSYHYDPDTIDFFEVAMEVCDATFDYTEDNLADAGGAFLPGLRLCPWGSLLVEEVSLTKSLNFNGSSDRIQVGGTTTDWSLNNLFYTIEFWSKATSASGGGPLTVMSQAPDNNRIDIYYQNELLYVNNGRALLAEPTPGVWTHVALVCTGGGGTDLKVYYNGVNVYTGGGYYVNDVANDLWIGSRGNNTFQYFNGKIANIRISDTPRYSATFTPPLTLVTDANTKLALSGELVDLSASAHTITNNGVSESTDFPT
jgi:hypothetical protein